jgi:hypothetical protein
VIFKFGQFQISLVVTIAFQLLSVECRAFLNRKENAYDSNYATIRDEPIYTLELSKNTFLYNIPTDLVSSIDISKSSGLVNRFILMGEGVPLSILHDNTHIALAKIYGGRREHACFHRVGDLFRERLGHPSKGNDTGASRFSSDSAGRGNRRDLPRRVAEIKPTGRP